MDKPFISTRDLFLAPAVAFIIFVLAQKLGYSRGQWLLALTAIAAAAAVFAFAGTYLVNRRSGALNAYSGATAFAALLFAFKWSAEL